MLQPDEPAPFEVVAGGSRSPFVLLCDHAGRRIPRVLGDLGLSPAELDTHVAWDIGAAGLARKLAASLDACAILQTYSRLVIDCNRPLDSPSSIVSLSERTHVPGNRMLSRADAEERARSVFQPYHARIVAELERRARARQPSVVVTVHSFTPVYMNQGRAWHAGVLYQRDARLAGPLLALLRTEPDLVVGDNQPYAVSDQTDYAVVEYGERGGRLHVEIEVRQDLIADDAGQAEWAARLARILPLAYAEASSDGTVE
ncbi:MAG: N-formylglutamate amidohydrolase [Polyangiales bacterium]